MISPSELAAIRARAEAATKGPWIAEQRGYGYPKVDGGPIIRIWDVRSASGVPVAVGTIADENEANAHLMAAAPRLLTDAAECRALIAEMVEAVKALEAQSPGYCEAAPDCGQTMPLCATCRARAALSRAAKVVGVDRC